MDIKRIRKSGDIKKLRLKMWRMVVKAEKLALDDDTKTNELIRAIHAMVQASSAYLKIVEMDDIESRITQLETKLSEK